MTYADVADNTTATRFLHEFPQLHRVHSDDVIEFLLEKDARKHGISSVVMYNYNGTVFFTDEKEDGSFIGVDEFQKGAFYVDIVSVSVERIAEFIKALGFFPREISFYGELSCDEIKQALYIAGVPVRDITCIDEQYLYTGEKIEIQENKLTIQLLSVNDLDDIKEWASRYGSDWKLEERLTQRDIYHNGAYDKPYGIYDGNTLVGVTGTGLYELKGFRVGDVEAIRILGEYKSSQNCDYIYGFLINDLLSSGYLPSCSYIGKPNADVMDLIPSRFGFEVAKTLFTFE